MPESRTVEPQKAEPQSSETVGAGPPATRPETHPDRRIALVDLLDRVLGGGVVVQGELSLCIADVELVRISLRAVVASVSALVEDAAPAREPRR